MSTVQLKEKQDIQIKNQNNTSPVNIDTEKLPIREMNTLLADLHLHYQALRNFHWNVQGEQFFTLHNVFEDHYNAIKVQIDELAERIKMLGFQPIAKYRTMLDESRLVEPEVPESSRDMVAFLALNLRTLQGFFEGAIQEASKANDSVSEDLLISIKSVLDKQEWMLTSWLK